MSLTTSEEVVSLRVGEGRVKIPIRNLWLLYLYASKFYEHLTQEERTRAEDSPESLVELAATILIAEADRRLQRTLTVGYVERHEVISAVRDRIDHLGTARGGYLERGKVLCRFDELTIDTPRNRYVLSALALAGRRLHGGVHAASLAQRCLAAAARLERQGIGPGRPDPGTPRSETYGHFDSPDRRMMAAAQLVIDALMPSHATGSARFLPLDYDDSSLRRTFEEAIRNFYRVNLAGWVIGARSLWWPSEGGPIDPLFPSMRTDITLDDPRGRRTIIDTKFACALSQRSGHYGGRLHSGHLYQLYTYIRTQVDGPGDNGAASASGMLLYPATDEAPEVNAMSVMHGHSLRVSTVDLSGSSQAIRARLLELVGAL